MLFCLVLQQFCVFSGTWSICYLIVLHMQFTKKVCFSATFFFSEGKFDAKKDQKCEFWLHTISVKIKMFKRLFKHCYFSVGILTLVKSSAKWKHLEQKGPQTPPPPYYRPSINADLVGKTLKICNLRTSTIIIAIIIIPIARKAYPPLSWFTHLLSIFYINSHEGNDDL